MQKQFTKTCISVRNHWVPLHEVHLLKGNIRHHVLIVFFKFLAYKYNIVMATSEAL